MVRQISSEAAPEAAVPFIRSALEATAGSDDEDLISMHRGLQVESALLIDHDPVKALGLKREGLPEGWDTDPRQLNRFAWWCFENDVNLEEALALALQGVELSESPGDQANILDTAAELCNKLGNCGEAVQHMQRAVELNPDRQYYKDQLAKFEALLAEQDKG
jgi:tetratricopeptide (TPR) repeat protein